MFNIRALPEILAYYDISILYTIKSMETWQWLMVRLPGGINQLLIEGLPAAGYGNQSGILLDDVTVKPCEHFSKSEVRLYRWVSARKT